MMPSVSGVTLAIGSSPASSILAKVTVTTIIGLAASRPARRNCAAMRHALLAATFGLMLLMPVSAMLMPPLRVGVPVAAGDPTTSVPFKNDVGTNSPTATAASEVRANAITPDESKFSIADVLVAGWAAGVVLFLLPVVIGLWQVRSLCRSGLPWRGGQSLVESLAVEIGVRRRVEVLLHEALPGPMTCGVVHPDIVLPRDAENWPTEDLNRAIVHELEHVRRGDSVTRCIARIACALYWFHPLVWIAWRKLVLEAERACDDAVLSRSEATAYADQLVELAKRLSLAQRSPRPARLLAMANRADLATRVGAVLDDRQRRGRTGYCR